MRKTKTQLETELRALRGKLAELEAAGARTALQASEQRFRSTFEQAAVGINHATSEGHFLRVNQRFCEIVGYTEAELLGLGFQDITHPDDLAADLEYMRQILAGEIETFSEEKRFIRKDGSTVWVNVTVSPVHNADGQIDYYAAVVQDIGRRKEIEATLRRQNDYLAALQETTLDLISRLDLDSLLINIVKRAMQLMDTRNGYLDLLDLDTHQLQPKVGLGVLRESLKFSVKPGEGLAGTVWQTGKPMVINDYDAWPGRIKDFSHGTLHSIIGMPLKSGDRVLGVLGLAYDTSTDRIFKQEDIDLLIQFARLAAIALENAQLVEALRRQANELQTRNEELDAFAHTVAHDLKNPIGTIIGYAETLSQDLAAYTEEERQLSLQTIARMGRKTDRIIDELMLLTGVRKTQVEMKPLNMVDILTEVQHRLADLIEERHCEIVLPEVAAWPKVLGHAPWVEEVWANYLNNAIKYGGQPPRIELGAEAQPDGMVRFWVHDNGLGIAPEAQARLFTPFTRLDQVRAKGYGLGLSVVRRIVEKLGGQVGVESELDQGTTFYFTLPAAR